MANGIYNTVSGVVAQTRTMEVVANNLANISTSGFKADRVSFAEVLSKAEAKGIPGGGSFVKTAEVRMDLRPGSLRNTESRRDVALEGPGYLCLKSDANKLIYSRGGTLQVLSDGVLADQDGIPLLGINNKVLRPGVEAIDLTIGTDGTVYVEDRMVGALKMVEFKRPEVLERLGNTRYEAPPLAGPAPAINTTVRQGHLEMANYNPVRGVTSMVVASRTYEAFHRILSTFKEVDRAANKLGAER
jgi:flagellar basal body rod protein FlgG